MTPEQKQQLISDIEARQEERRKRCEQVVRGTDIPLPPSIADIDSLLSLVKSQEAVGIADDLPYRIVEEMGLGLTFRSCTCGQLPCARLRPLRSALEAIATSMRSACVEKVKAMRDEWHDRYVAASSDNREALVQKELLFAKCRAASGIITALESVTIQASASEKGEMNG